MSKTTPRFGLERLYYYPDATSDHRRILVAVIVTSNDGRVRTTHSCPLEGVDPMNREVVNATLAELGQADTFSGAYLALRNSTNTLRLDVAEPLEVEELSSASAAALGVLLEARPEAHGKRTAAASA